MADHRLGSLQLHSTARTGTGLGVVLLSQVSVESLHEGCPDVTDVTLPGFVVLVLAMHVIHQPPNPPTLLVAELRKRSI